MVGNGGVVLHYDGLRWEPIALSGYANLTVMTASPDGVIYGAGSRSDSIIRLGMAFRIDYV